MELSTCSEVSSKIIPCNFLAGQNCSTLLSALLVQCISSFNEIQILLSSIFSRYNTFSLQVLYPNYRIFSTICRIHTTDSKNVQCAVKHQNNQSSQFWFFSTPLVVATILFHSSIGVFLLRFCCCSRHLAVFSLLATIQETYWSSYKLLCYHWNEISLPYLSYVLDFFGF